MNLKERFDRKSETPDPETAGSYGFTPAPASDPSPQPNAALDEANESVEPTQGTILARRAMVVAVGILLVAIGAVGGRQVLRSGAVPTAALTVPQEQASSTTMLPAEAVPATDPPTTTPPDTEVPTTDPTATLDDETPDGASRLVPLDPERVLDTGDEPTDGRKYTVDLDREWAAVALSVTLAAPADAGSVLIDGGAGAIEAIGVDGAGQATTNLVFVPVNGTTLGTWSTAGGRVVIDLVGGFETVTEADAGRFVAVNPTEIGRLVTATDGRETDLPFEAALPIDEADAVLVVIGADVGDDGGVVRFGPEADAYDQQLMWGPAGGSPQRRGLVLLRPNELGGAHLRYEGGTELSAHVVGYFTNETQPTSTAGLYLPNGPQRLHDGVLRPEDPVVVDGLEPTAGTALVTVGSASITSGRLGTYLVPVDGGRVTLTPSTEVDSVVTLLGVFLGEIR